MLLFRSSCIVGAWVLLCCSYSNSLVLLMFKSFCIVDIRVFLCCSSARVLLHYSAWVFLCCYNSFFLLLFDLSKLRCLSNLAPMCVNWLYLPCCLCFLVVVHIFLLLLSIWYFPHPFYVGLGVKSLVTCIYGQDPCLGFT